MALPLCVFACELDCKRLQLSGYLAWVGNSRLWRLTSICVVIENFRRSLLSSSTCLGIHRRDRRDIGVIRDFSSVL